MLRYLTSGESHGRCLISILEGMPAGVLIDKAKIDKDLLRRQLGFGRGGRMAIERDKVQILSGVRKGRTLGSPIALLIENKDKSIDMLPVVTCPRPGHADLAGGLKYNQKDLRNILERASARETASRVAVGAIGKILLSAFDIEIISHVISLGGIDADTSGMSIKQIRIHSEKSPIRCADKIAGKLMIEQIDKTIKNKDTLGGIFEIIAIGVPCGLGSFVHYDRKLDGKLAAALMSIQAIKGLQIGLGFEASGMKGSEVHDEIFYTKKTGFFRKANNSGGIEGGVSNGQPIVIRCAMKPISTLMKPLASVDIITKKARSAAVERADVCAVPAAGVVGEATVAFELAGAMIEKFGGDALLEMKRNFDGYMRQVKNF